MGIHHAMGMKKNLFLMTCSFAVSIILFLCFSVTIDFMHQAIKPLRPYTPDLSIISEDQSCSIDRSIFQQIRNHDQVKRTYGRMFAYNIPITAGQQESIINLNSYEENQFKWAENDLVSGSIDQVMKGNDSVLVVYSEDLTCKVGDSFNMEFPKGEKKVKIAGILATSPFSSEQGKQTVICSEALFTQLTGQNQFTIIDIQLTAQATDKTVDEIRSLTTSQMKFSDQRQSNQEGQAVYYSFALFLYGFLSIIALITVFNISNSMNLSVSGRMNQYGVLRAIGMSRMQIVRMVMTEAVTYSTCGCIIGCIIGLPLHNLIFSKMIAFHWGIQWQLPLNTLLLIVGLTAATTLISVIHPLKRLQKSVITTLQ